jgi:hypothetical protein
MRVAIVFLWAALLGAALPGGVFAGAGGDRGADAELGMRTESQASVRAPEWGAGLTVHLVTFGPGTAVWERFGHNAIWIHDERRGTDIAYHYGLFDFNQEDFILRLLRGRMFYWMGRFDATDLMDDYAADGRPVWIQELNLTAVQAAKLREFLEWNARPENRFYRYDYYRDNCSTRIRDALNHVLGGEIRRQLEDLPTGTTYRSHTLRLTAADVPVSTGLLLALGQPVDQPLSAWEETFVPMELREQLRRVTVPGPEGSRVPLIRSERTLFQAERTPLPTDAPDRIPAYLLTGLLVGGVFATLGTRASDPRSQAARWGLASLGAFWGLVAGTFGAVLLGLWAFTEHDATYWNENLLQINPIALVLVALVPMAVFGRGRAAQWAVRLGLLLAALSFFGAVIQLLPGLDQANGEIVALALPIHLGLAWALWRVSDTGDSSARAFGTRKGHSTQSQAAGA